MCGEPQPHSDAFGGDFFAAIQAAGRAARSAYERDHETRPQVPEWITRGWSHVRKEALRARFVEGWYDAAMSDLRYALVLAERRIEDLEDGRAA